MRTLTAPAPMRALLAYHGRLTASSLRGSLPALGALTLLFLWGSGDPLKASVLPLVGSCLLGLGVTFQGLMDRSETFLAGLPVTRAQVVQARYLASLAGLSFGAFLPLGFGLLLHLGLPGHFPVVPTEAWGVATLTLLAEALLLFAFLPLAFRHGGPKGAGLFSAGFVITLAAYLSWRGFQPAVEDLANLGGRILDLAPWTWGALILTLLLGLLSQALASKGYEKRGL